MNKSNNNEFLERGKREAIGLIKNDVFDADGYKNDGFITWFFGLKLAYRKANTKSH